MDEPIKLTEARLSTLVDARHFAFCTLCKNQQSGIEPDEHNLACEACGEYAVVAVEQLLLQGNIDVVDR